MISLSKSVCRDCSVVLVRVDEAHISPKKTNMTLDSGSQTCRVCCSPSQLTYFGILSCKACRCFFQKVKQKFRKVIDQPCQQIPFESHSIKKCRPCRAKMCIKVGFRCRGFSPSDFPDGPSQEKVVKELNSVGRSRSELKQPNKTVELKEVNKKDRERHSEINKSLKKILKSTLAEDSAKKLRPKVTTNKTLGVTEKMKKEKMKSKNLQPKVTTNKTLVVTEKIKKEKIKSKNLNPTNIDKTKTNSKSLTKTKKSVKQLGSNKSQPSPDIDLSDDITFQIIQGDLPNFRITKANESNSKRTVVNQGIGEKKEAKIGPNNNTLTSAVESDLKDTSTSENEKKRKYSCFGKKSFNIKKARKLSPESKRTPVWNEGCESPKVAMLNLKKPKEKTTRRKETESSRQSSTEGQTCQKVNAGTKLLSGSKIDKTASKVDSFYFQSDSELDYGYADSEDNEGSSGLRCNVGGEDAARVCDSSASLPGGFGQLDSDQGSNNSVSLSLTNDDESSEEVFDKLDKSESEVNENDENFARNSEKDEDAIDSEVGENLDVDSHESELEDNSLDELKENLPVKDECELEDNLSVKECELEENLSVKESELEDNFSVKECELEDNISVKDGCEKSVSEAEDSLLRFGAPKSVEVDEKTDDVEDNKTGNLVSGFNYFTNRKTYRPRRARDRWNRFNDDSESDSSSSSECSPVKIKEEPPCSDFAMPDEPPAAFAKPALPSFFKFPKKPQKKVTSQFDRCETITIEDDSISLFAPNVDLLSDSDSLLTGLAWKKSENTKFVPKPSSKSSESFVVKPTKIPVPKPSTRFSPPSASVDTLDANPTTSKSSQQTGTVRSKACPKSRKPLAAAANSISNSTKLSPRLLKSPLNTVLMKSPICKQSLTPAATSTPPTKINLRLSWADKPNLNSIPRLSPKSNCPENKPMLNSRNLPTSTNKPIVEPSTFPEEVQPSISADTMISNDFDEGKLSKFMTAVKSRDVKGMQKMYLQVKPSERKLRGKMVREMIEVYLEMKRVSEAFARVPDIRHLEIRTPSIMKALLEKCCSLPPTAQKFLDEFIDYVISINFEVDGVNLSTVLDGLLEKKAVISLWKLIKYTANTSYSPSVKILKWVIDQLDGREDELSTILDVFMKFQGDLNRIAPQYIRKLKNCVKKLRGLDDYNFLSFLRQKNYNLDALKEPVEKFLVPSNARRKLWEKFESTEKLNEKHLNALRDDLCRDFFNVEQSLKSFKNFVRGRIARDAHFKRLVTNLSLCIILECHSRNEYKSGHAVMMATFSDSKSHFDLLETNDIQSVITVHKMALTCLDICLQVGDEKSAIVILKASEGAALDDNNKDAKVRRQRLQLLKLLFNKLDVRDYSNQIYVFNCYLQSIKLDKAILKLTQESRTDITDICITLMIRLIENNDFENASIVFQKGRANALLMSDDCFRGYLILTKRNVEIVGRKALHLVFRVCLSETIYPSIDFKRMPMVINIRNYFTVEEIEVILDWFLDGLVKLLGGKKPTTTISIYLEKRPCTTQLSVLECSQEMLNAVTRLSEALSNLSPLLHLEEVSGSDRIFKIKKKSLEKFIQQRQESQAASV